MSAEKSESAIKLCDMERRILKMISFLDFSTLNFSRYIGGTVHSAIPAKPYQYFHRLARKTTGTLYIYDVNKLNDDLSNQPFWSLQSETLAFCDPPVSDCRLQNIQYLSSEESLPDFLIKLDQERKKNSDI